MRHFAGFVVVLALAFNPASAVAGTLSANPPSVSFGNVFVGNTAIQNVTITNSGADTTIGDDTFTGTGQSSFSTDEGCDGQVLGNGGSCVIQVSFQPSARGGRIAALNVPSDANTVLVNLQGTGVAPVIGISPGSLAFGSRHVGTQSATQTVTVTNTGDSSGSVAVAKSGGDAAAFPITNGCLSAIAPGGSCQVSIAFAPTSAGAKSASLDFTTNDPANPNQSVGLSGTGTAPIVGITDGPLGFGLQHVGTQSGSMVVTVANGAGANEAATVSAALSGANADAFAITTSSCNSAVAPGGSCQVSVVFTAASAGPRSASLDFTTNDPANPSESVALSGTGTSPIVSVPAGPLDFGTQVFGGAPLPPHVVTVSNDAGANEAASVSFAFSGANAGDFIITSNGCVTPVAPGGSCDLIVAFVPSSPGTKSASLDVTTNDPGNPSDSITLSGTTTTPSSSADTAAPETTITKPPNRRTTKRRATFEFTANEDGSTFECSLDGRAFAPCTSPFARRVKRGRHTFEVRATDPAGNTDPTPAKAVWKVRRKRR